MSAIDRYAVPSPMLSGPGALAELGDVAEKECGIGRPFVMTDPGIRACGILDRALRGLGTLAVQTHVFDQVSSNCTEDDVLAALRLYRKVGADGIIGVGGGSALDAAKGLRLLSAHEGGIADYDLLRGGLNKIVNELPPQIAVPTTAGTGSEVSRGALIITRKGDRVRKTIVGSPRLVPTWAILDAELTVSLPPPLTAGTGMDALSHCVEELVSPRHHPLVAAIAISGLERIARDLPRVWREPENLEARGNMLLSAMMAGIGFEKGLGAPHSMAHAIGAVHDIHHGRLCACLTPTGLEFNRGHLAPGVSSQLATAAGLDSSGVDTDNEALSRLIEWLHELNSNLEIPSRLRDLGVPEEDRDSIVARALEDHCHRTNPRSCGPEEMLELWERAW